MVRKDFRDCCYHLFFLIGEKLLLCFMQMRNIMVYGEQINTTNFVMVKNTILPYIQQCWYSENGIF